jgi:7-cyano-7-deazaguanine synthase in queuosine biosynthesis
VIHTPVLLSSGGMDSFFTAWKNTEYPLHHIYVDVGHRYSDKEHEAARRMAKFFKARLTVMKGAQLGRFEHHTGIIPFRNAELILCAAQYGSEINLGVLAGEINSDKSFEFFRAMEDVLNISHQKQYWTQGRKFTIATPISQYSKAELVKRMWDYCSHNEQDPYWKALMATVSCYDGEHQHCGCCASCFKRWVALTVGTGKDHGHLFHQHPADWLPQGATATSPAEYWLNKYEGQRANEIAIAYGLRS